MSLLNSYTASLLFISISLFDFVPSILCSSDLLSWSTVPSDWILNFDTIHIIIHNQLTIIFALSHLFLGFWAASLFSRACLQSTNHFANKWNWLSTKHSMSKKIIILIKRKKNGAKSRGWWKKGREKEKKNTRYLYIKDKHNVKKDIVK